MAIVDQKEVARAARDWQQRILGQSPNLAIPAVMQLMLLELDRITRELESANEERERPLAAIGPDEIDLRLEHWRARLVHYMKKNAEAPAPDDREAILWDVTAPLLLGFHGGLTGTEVELAPNGYPPGFNAAAAHGADVSTPYTLANQLEVAAAFERESRDQAIREMKDRAEGALEAATRYWPWVLGGAFVVVAGGAAIYAGVQSRALRVALGSEDAA